MRRRWGKHANEIYRYLCIFQKCLPTLHKDLDLNTHLVASLILQPALKPILQAFLEIAIELYL